MMFFRIVCWFFNCQGVFFISKMFTTQYSKDLSFKDVRYHQLMIVFFVRLWLFVLFSSLLFCSSRYVVFLRLSDGQEVNMIKRARDVRIAVTGIFRKKNLRIWKPAEDSFGLVWFDFDEVIESVIEIARYEGISQIKKKIQWLNPRRCRWIIECRLAAPGMTRKPRSSYQVINSRKWNRFDDKERKLKIPHASSVASRYFQTKWYY